MISRYFPIQGILQVLSKSYRYQEPNRVTLSENTEWETRHAFDVVVLGVVSCH